MQDYLIVKGHRTHQNQTIGMEPDRSHNLWYNSNAPFGMGLLHSAIVRCGTLDLGNVPLRLRKEGDHDKDISNPTQLRPNSVPMRPS